MFSKRYSKQSSRRILITLGDANEQNNRVDNYINFYSCIGNVCWF